MAIRKKTASLTLADGGQDYEDLAVRGVDSRDRWNGCFGVRVTTSEIKATLAVTVYELEDLDDDGAMTYGEILFHIDGPESGKTYYPREESYTREGSGTGEENGVPHIGSEQIRVEAIGGTNASAVTVDVFLQTAGDQRF